MFNIVQRNLAESRTTKQDVCYCGVPHEERWWGVYHIPYV